MKFEKKNLFWIREANQSDVADEKIIIRTKPKTDLWQRTYYGFQNDSAPVLQMKTSEKYFSFTVKTKFDSKKDSINVVLWCIWTVKIGLRHPLNIKMNNTRGWAVWLQIMAILTGLQQILVHR